jgi:hypothetical protein
MMNRRNRILAGILLLQIVVAVIVFWPRRSPSAAAGGTGSALFPGLQADKISKLTIRDTAGQQVQLARVPDGWVMPDADNYPCVTTTVQSLLDKLVALKVDRLVTKTAASHSRLQVADQGYVRLVEFVLADGTLHKLYLGVASGYQAVHVRADSQSEVYLANGLVANDAGAQASAWIAPNYFNVSDDQLQGVTVTNSKGTLEFQKGAGGNWTLAGLAAGETPNADAIRSLVSLASSVSVSRPLGKTEQDSYGLKTPQAVVTLLAQNPDSSTRTLTLRVGAQDVQDLTYVVSSSESPYFVRVAASAVQELLNKTHADLLVLPPTPEVKQ